jgi:hypothetical protein
MTGRTLLKVGALAALLGGGFLMVGAGSSYLRNRKALTDWPAADAVVTRSVVVRRGVGRASPKYLAEFDSRFTVNGQEYTGSLPASSRTFSREDSEKETKRFPLGSRHRIRYNPAKPTESVLDADPSDYFLTALVPFLVGMVMAAIGAIVLGARLLKVRRQ